MLIVWPLAAVIVLVFFGYIALLGMNQANISQGTAKLGKVISIALFVIAGIVLIVSLWQALVPRRPYYRPAYGGFNPMTQRPGTTPFGVRPAMNANQPGAPGMAQPAPTQPVAMPVAPKRRTK